MAYETASADVKRDVSRIETDVELVKSMGRMVAQTTERIMRHARALGYYEPPAPEKTAPLSLSPAVISLADALMALDREINTCSGSLNVFD